MKLKKKNYYTFNKNNKKFLMDIYKMKFAEITEDEYIIFNEQRFENCNEHLTEKILKLNELDLFFSDDTPTEFIDTKTRELSFSLPSVHSCNLNCKYCFANAGENFQEKDKSFSKEMVEKCLKFLVNNSKLREYEKYRLDFVSGGEPLLDKKSLYEIIDLAKHTFESEEKDLFIWLCTNATLVKEKDLEEFSKKGIRVGISLDGDKEGNDYCRTYKNGLGTYEDILKTIEMIKESKNISKYLKELWGLSVLTKKNQDLIKICNHMIELGFTTLQMRLVRTQDEELVFSEKCSEVLFKNIEEFIEYLFKNAIDNYLDPLQLILNDNDYIGKIIRRIILESPYVRRCKAGLNKFSFAANGDIYPCDAFVGNEEFKLGNIDTGFNEERLKKFEDLSVFSREKCSLCWARFICGGDCYHNGLLVNDNISIPDSNFCEMVYHIITTSVYWINELMINNEDAYLMIRKIISMRSNLHSN